MPALSVPISARSRVVLACIVAGGGTAIFATKLAKQLRSCRAQQKSLATLCLGSEEKQNESIKESADRRRKNRIAVDKLFFRRLVDILKVCIPGLLSREALLLGGQGIFLLARTLLSDRITKLEGVCAENVTAQNWTGFKRVLVSFALNSIPATIVNSALKSLQVLVQLAFRIRLSKYLHTLYLGNRAYYAASVLGGLSHPDLRISDDVDKFSETFSELCSYTFKPLLDVIVFSRSLGDIIGYKGQVGLYVYFIVIGSVLRKMSPPLGRMTAEYASLNGDFCVAHHRVVTNAEEIAFNDPPSGRAEMQALNSRLERTVSHSMLSVVQRFVQQCFDGYLVKYTASIIGLVIFAAPLYYTPVAERAATNVIAGQYINAMRLMMQASSSMGQLVLVYKRMNTLAGHTARVAELMEKVKELGQPRGHLDAFRKIQERIGGGGGDGSESTRLVKGEIQDASTSTSVVTTITDVAREYPPKRMNCPSIKLENVSMWSPDGSPLVRNLSFEVVQGTSVIIVGPNGSGKSSVLRMLAGLWPLQAGSVGLPARNDIFYLSQRPYMYSGTLKEQLMYPYMPGVVIGENVMFDDKHGVQCLESVEMGSLVSRCGGFDGKLPWDDALSGGERNRLAVARLMYHKPRFAVLDECTAAVSADGEAVLYEAMASAGITMLSVAHRKGVMNFHQVSVVLDGTGDWKLNILNGAEPNGVEDNENK